MTSDRKTRGRSRTGNEAKASRVRKPRRRTAARADSRKASRAYKHKRDLQGVMRALYNFLERAGLQMDPYHERWTWNDAVRPAPDGSQATCWLWDLAAMVTAAAMTTADACGWMDGPLGELDTRATAAQSAKELMPWLRKNREALCRLLRNIRVVEKEGVAFGARTLPSGPAEAAAAIDALLNEPTETGLEQLRAAFQTLAPRPVVAGFYRPGAAGPMGQFCMHLREDGLEYHELAEILGDLPTRESFRSDDAYARQRAAVVDALKHRINALKLKLLARFGSDRVLGDRARNLPRHKRWAVLFSIRVEAHSTATIHI
jgi:hypothetical protein